MGGPSPQGNLGNIFQKGSTENNAPTQVYYDPEKQQYFSYKSAETNPAQIMLNQIMGVTPSQDRMYLNNPFMTQNRFNSNSQATPYAELTNLFPSLNNNAQSLLAPTDTQSSGAGRFIAPSNTSQGK
jgi:hypothetical protein